MTILFQVNHPQRMQDQWGMSATYEFDVNEKDRMTVSQITEALKTKLGDEIPAKADLLVYYKGFSCGSGDVLTEFMGKGDILVCTYR